MLEEPWITTCAMEKRKAGYLYRKYPAWVLLVPPIYIALWVLCGLKGTPTGYAICPASEDGTSVVSICGVLYHL